MRGGGTVDLADSSQFVEVDLSMSAKMTVALRIVAGAAAAGEKVVLFSRALPSLTLIEHVLQMHDWGGIVNGHTEQNAGRTQGS